MVSNVQRTEIIVYRTERGDGLSADKEIAYLRALSIV
jgi:hypothetical protein